MANFKQRWQIKSNWQVVVILLVFAITGSTAAYLAKPLLSSCGINKKEVSAWLYYPLYVLLLFPIYQILLLSFGFLSGQFRFFWSFEKKLLKNCGLGFMIPKKENPE
jgi:hypothetical protein